MRTIIQLAASSRLDLTKYKDAIIKVATDHREPIVQYHDELSKIIGQDAMRNIDSILQIYQQEISKPIQKLLPQQHRYLEGTWQYTGMHIYCNCWCLLAVAAPQISWKWQLR